MKNDYEVRGDVTAIIIDSPKYGIHEVLISTNKLEYLNNFPNSWSLCWNEHVKSFYVQSKTPRLDGKRTNVILHRLIANAPIGMVVDHIDHDTLNNTNENLRVVTHAENKQNLKGAHTNNYSSGIRGVYWDKQKGKWKAQLNVNKKTIRLGLFTDIEDAKRAVIEARIKYMPFSKEDESKYHEKSS